MRMNVKLVLPLILLAEPTWADCGGSEQTFLTCQIENSSKSVSVCFDDEIATYRFGPKMGIPELELTEPIASLGYTPWPGAGDTLWEEVMFSNSGYTYTVVSGLKRTFPDEKDAVVVEGLFGGVLVRRGEEEIANFSCDPFSVYYDFMGALSLAKNRLGFIYSDGGWVRLPD